MLNLGLGELIIIFIVISLIVGPGNLPVVFRKIIKILNEFRFIGNKLKKTIFNYNIYEDLNKNIVKNDFKKSKNSIKSIKNLIDKKK
jgi:Sec-independent protein translocase protein TatA